jgi:hypothetical protein
VDEFVPYQVEGGSRLVRELARLDLRLRVKITAADDRDVDDNTVDYKLVPFRLGMHFEDMPLPEFNDIVFIRRRPQHETTIKDIAALAFAASRNYVESMRTMLFDTRIDPNSLDYDGRTALYVAVNNQQLEAIQLLLEAGADPFIVDSTGSTPVDRARELERDDIVEMLLANSTGAPPAQLKETELRVVDMHEREASARTVKSAVATRKGFSERLDKELLDPDFRAPAPAAPAPPESAESDQFTVGGLVKTNWSVAASRAMTPGGRRLPQVPDDPDMPSPLAHGVGSIGRPASDGVAHHAFSPFDLLGPATGGTLHARTESMRPAEPKRVNFSDNGLPSRPRINSLGPGARSVSTPHGLVDVIESGEVSAAQVAARLHNNTPLANGRAGLSRTAGPTQPVTPHLHTSPTTSPRNHGPASDRLGLMTNTRSKSSREHIRPRDAHNGDAHGGGAAVPKQPASPARGGSERGALSFARGGRSHDGPHTARDDRSAATMAGSVASVTESPREPWSGDEAGSDEEIEMTVIVRSPMPAQHEVGGPRGRKGTAGKKGHQMASLGEFEARGDDSDSDSDSSNIDSGMYRESPTVAGAHPVGVYDVDNSGTAGADKPVKRVSMIGVKAAHGHRAGVAGEEQLGVSTVKRLHLTERRISTKTPKKKKKKVAAAAAVAAPASGSDEPASRAGPSPTMGSTAATHVVSGGDTAVAATTSSTASAATPPTTAATTAAAVPATTSSSSMPAGESPLAPRSRMVSVRSATDLLAMDERGATPSRTSVALTDDEAVTVRRFPAVRTAGGNAAATVKPQTEVMSSSAAAAAVKAGSAASGAPVAPSVPATPAAAPTAESSIPPTPDPSFFKKLLGRARTQDGSDDDGGAEPAVGSKAASKGGAEPAAVSSKAASKGGAAATTAASTAAAAATTPAARAAAVAVAIDAACDVPATKSATATPAPMSPRSVSFADRPAVAIVLTDTEDSTTPISTAPTTAAATTTTAAAAATTTSTSKSPRRRKKKPHIVVTRSDDDTGATTTQRDEDSAESDDHVHNMTRRNQAKLATLRRNHLVSMPGTVSDADSSHERRHSASGKAESGDEARDDTGSNGGGASGGASGGESGGRAADGAGDSVREASEADAVDPAAVPAQARLEQEKLGFFSRAVRRMQARNMVTNLEAAFIESYRGLVLLRNFGELNKQAVDKILKKHDKQLGTRFRESWQAQNCYQLTFCEQSMLGDLMREMELLYAQAYTHGHRTDAMNRLRVPDDGEHDVEVPAFQFGITLGLTLTMLAIAIYIFGADGQAAAVLHRDVHHVPRLFHGDRAGVVLGPQHVLVGALPRQLRLHFRVQSARAHQAHHDVARGVDFLGRVGALLCCIWALSVARPAGFAWLGDVPPCSRCRSPC